MNGERVPLAERMRPQKLSEVVGQSDLIGEGKILTEIARAGRPVNLIFWGPPGTGKTTLARILAREFQADFVELSAVTASKKDVIAVVERARTNWNLQIRTVLFVDEIHRFNKAQQDAFLPHVESGLIILIGATTENPSFEVIAPLLSRSRVVVLRSLSKAEILRVLKRALRLLHKTGTVTPAALDLLAELAQGDARQAIGDLELALELAAAGGEMEKTGEMSKSVKNAEAQKSAETAENRQKLEIPSKSTRKPATKTAKAQKNVRNGRAQKIAKTAKNAEVDKERKIGKIAKNSETVKISKPAQVTPELVRTAVGRKPARFDKKGDAHYDTISAFIKSLRAGDVDATLYYLARMVQGGEDPKFIARRLVIFASEDVGLGTNGALPLAVAAFQAIERVGMPEGGIILSHVAVVLARARKSRATYDAWDKAQAVAAKTADFPIPLHVRNAPTKLMKDLGYGKGYKWEAGFKHAESYLPSGVEGGFLEG